MCTTVSLGNVVGVAVQSLLESVVPLQRDLHLDAIIRLCLKMAHFGDGRFTLIQKLDKGAQPALVRKKHLFSCALIFQQDAHTAIEKCQLPQALTQHIVVENNVGKGIGGRRKAH